MDAPLTMLGRGIVVGPRADAPPEYVGARRVVVDAGVVATPSDAVDVLHDHWLRREPVVIELAAASELRVPEVVSRAPWELGAGFELGRDRLQFLVWANTWDGRAPGEPIWWWGRKAARLGATVGGPADVVLPDGSPAWVDGGPRGVLAVDGTLIHRESVEVGALRPAAWRAPHADLAADQLVAVSHPVGPARIIAPAGSGKTRVLTERLRHLLADRRWEAGVVTAVAFNKRAADELVARTDGLGAHVRTINALGLAVLTGAMGGPAPVRRPAVIDERDVRTILDPIVMAEAGLRRQRNTDALAPYLLGLSLIRIGLHSPDEAEVMADAPGLAQVWPRYRDTLEAEGAVDFDDQIYQAIRRLLTSPSVRTAAQLRCRHLLVDEFQDLAPAHLLLLRLLAAPGYDVFGVGDDDQVIYGFAGATPEYLIDFGRYFPGAAAHALEVNYRCPTTVVDGARHLLRYNATRIPKVLRTPLDAPAGALEVRVGGSASAAVLEAVAAGHALDEIAVLTRVNSALLPAQVALHQAGVATNRAVDEQILGRTGVRTALAWLRMGVDPGNIARADITETVHRPSRKIARNVADMLVKRSRTSAHDIRRLAERLSGGDVDKLIGYADDIETVGRAAASGTGAALAAIRTSVGLGQTMASLDGGRASADRSTHGDDLRALEQLAPLHESASTFEAWLRAALSEPVEPGPVVTLSTIHRVKGQEWPVVVVAGVDDGLLPHELARTEADVEEERRVMHVAITRAAASAVVIADASCPSPFVAELDGSRAHVPVRAPVARVAAAGGGAGRAAAGAPAAVDAGLWEALRAWRREVATRTGVPAYVVLSDADLRGVAERMPKSMAELRQCRGFGPTKLERYGDELLAVLEAAAPA
jgi:DNA helicase-2/ATP-dependent DNA helicase PcrA